MIVSNEDANMIPYRYAYRYYWKDLKRKANIGELDWQQGLQKFIPADSNGIYWNVRDMDLGNGIRRGKSYACYNVVEVLKIYPQINCKLCSINCAHEHGYPENEDYLLSCTKCPDTNSTQLNVGKYDFKSNPDALVQELTYYQALAFYNWKFLSTNKTVDFDEIIHNELLPNEAEFFKIQAGE